MSASHLLADGRTKDLFIRFLLVSGTLLPGEIVSTLASAPALSKQKLRVRMQFQTAARQRMIAQHLVRRGRWFRREALRQRRARPSFHLGDVAGANRYIDLTSSTDTLNLNSLAGGFDGSSYTIATFNQNLGSGVSNTVTGLPANYVVAYLPTAIMIVPVPEPTIWALAVQATILLCWGARRLSNRHA